VRANLSPNFSPESYAAKASRWERLWPELTVIASAPMMAASSAGDA